MASKSATWVQLADCNVYVCNDVISLDMACRVTRYLETVPREDCCGHDPRQTFAFTNPVYDGTVVTSRAEAAAGFPIWFADEPVAALPIPAPLAALSTSLAATLPLTIEEAIDIARRPFSSVYVDHYPRGGSFVPHVDRDCYGPSVLGASLGPGTCDLVFAHANNAAESFAVTLEPRSAYLFFGAVRYPPWLHAVRSVTDERYGITFRQANSR
jgi:hypothetical protein